MRYLRVLGILYKAAILTDLEYRTNDIAYGLLSILGGGNKLERGGGFSDLRVKPGA